MKKLNVEKAIGLLLVGTLQTGMAVGLLAGMSITNAPLHFFLVAVVALFMGLGLAVKGIAPLARHLNDLDEKGVTSEAREFEGS